AYVGLAVGAGMSILFMLVQALSKPVFGKLQKRLSSKPRLANLLALVPQGLAVLSVMLVPVAILLHMQAELPQHCNLVVSWLVGLLVAGILIPLFSPAQRSYPA
ncbi:MAG: hypothetical protein K2X27_22785, partial [Candidatus Obscuribacterales bacterium]|nr:hypothetical protein [Candidatus Obscuribacterales bacterium]